MEHLPVALVRAKKLLKNNSEELYVDYVDEVIDYVLKEFYDDGEELSENLSYMSRDDIYSEAFYDGFLALWKVVVEK